MQRRFTVHRARETTTTNKDSWKFFSRFHTSQRSDYSVVVVVVVVSLDRAKQSQVKRFFSSLLRLFACNRDFTTSCSPPPSTSAAEQDQYWRARARTGFFSLSVSTIALCFIWTEKKDEKERYLRTFNYWTTSRERNVNTTSLTRRIFLLRFDGGHLINRLNWCKKPFARHNNAGWGSCVLTRLILYLIFLSFDRSDLLRRNLLEWTSVCICSLFTFVSPRDRCEWIDWLSNHKAGRDKPTRCFS